MKKLLDLSPITIWAAIFFIGMSIFMGLYQFFTTAFVLMLTYGWYAPAVQAFFTGIPLVISYSNAMVITLCLLALRAIGNISNGVGLYKRKLKYKVLHKNKINGIKETLICWNHYRYMIIAELGGPWIVLGFTWLVSWAFL